MKFIRKHTEGPWSHDMTNSSVYMGCPCKERGEIKQRRNMRSYDVSTPGDALAYITDCNLATIESMAIKKSRPKYEYQRQIGIAQKAVNWMKQMGISMHGTRAEDITGTVAEWAAQFEV